MPGRKFNTPAYRYGLNGQEKDDEISNIEGANTSAEYWEYDTRLGRRWNVDPIFGASFSPYTTFLNNPIFHTDVNGDYVDYAKRSDRRAARREARQNREFRAQLKTWESDKSTTYKYERKSDSPTIDVAQPTPAPTVGPGESDDKTGTDLLHVYYSPPGEIAGGLLYLHEWDKDKTKENITQVNFGPSGDNKFLFSTKRTVDFNPGMSVDFNPHEKPDRIEVYNQDGEPLIDPFEGISRTVPSNLNANCYIFTDGTKINAQGFIVFRPGDFLPTLHPTTEVTVKISTQRTFESCVTLSDGTTKVTVRNNSVWDATINTGATTTSTKTRHYEIYLPWPQKK